MIAYAEETVEQNSEQSPFDGFGGFTCRDEWRHASACIDNLAEFKIVEWLFRNGIWDEWVEITTEMFMHGYCDEDGLQVDSGTGLCKPSVIQGLRRAIDHGLIECAIDDRDKTAIRKFYRMRIAQVDVNDVYPENEEDEPDVNDLYIEVNDVESEEMPMEADFMRGKGSLPPTNNSNYPHTDITCSNLSRIQSLETLPENVNSNKPHRGQEKYPAFIRAVLKYLSVELGDGEHIASNIAQATAIYKQSGMPEEEFTKLLYDLEATARSKRGIKKVNSRGWPNRMPFYFACLKKAAVASRESITV